MVEAVSTSDFKKFIKALHFFNSTSINLVKDSVTACEELASAILESSNTASEPFNCAFTVIRSSSVSYTHLTLPTKA